MDKIRKDPHGDQNDGDHGYIQHESLFPCPVLYHEVNEPPCRHPPEYDNESEGDLHVFLLDVAGLCCLQLTTAGVDPLVALIEVAPGLLARGIRALVELSGLAIGTDHGSM